MIKNTFLVVLLSIIFGLTQLSAQDESFLGLCLGGALPQGTYAAKDFSNKQAGYANTGFLFTFDAAWFPDDYLGIGATVSYGSNNPDKKQYKTDLINDITERYPDFDFPEDSVYFDYGVWRYLNMHVGPNVTFRAGKFNFDLRALAGLTLAWAPSQEFEIKFPDGETFSRKVDNKATPTLGYTIGGGIRYALKSGYVIRFITEFTNFKPTMEIREDLIEDLENGSIPTTSEVDVPIKNIHIGIGIAYNFDI
ncbi:MAG: hypothetical protein JW731_08955 [Bacteroidales bacterium]|nr:hypothetical protein [Bacteroidales bacterium]